MIRKITPLYMGGGYGIGGFLAENYNAIYETGTFTITPTPAGGNTPG